MSLVTIDHRPPVRHVHLDTGPRNVLGIEAVRALAGALEPEPDAPVVVLTGREDGFCAGLDNATLAAGPPESDELLTTMGELLLSVLESPTRVVAVCRGHAVAAGAMLLLVADVRLASPGSYKVGFTEPGLGMPLPALPALLGRMRLDRRRLHELTALGRVVTPEDAVAAGFLDELVEGDITEVAMERARPLAALTDRAYAGSVASVWRPELERLGKIVAARRER